MDIITAIKSGRPFKRVGETCFTRADIMHVTRFAIEDILADDWITEEPKVKITESEFWKAVRNAQVKENMDRSYVYVGVADQANHELMTYVAEQLFGKKEQQGEK
jgi:uncharacterized protein (DUF2267 family)